MRIDWLIGLIVRRRGRKQFYPVYGDLQASEPRQAHSEMSDHDAVVRSLFPGDQKPDDLKSYVCNSSVEPKCWRGVEIDEWRSRASDSGNLALHAGDDLDWRRGCGFIGPDGHPWIWESSRDCWVSVTKSSRAADYEILRKRAPSA